MRSVGVCSKTELLQRMQRRYRFIGVEDYE